MPIPGEHKTVQARILEYAEAIGWTFVSQKAGFVLRLCRAKAVFVSRLGRAKVSCWRGLNRRERRDRKGDLDRGIRQQAAAKFSGWEFWRRLRENLATVCRRILEPAVQEMNRAPENP